MVGRKRHKGFKKVNTEREYQIFKNYKSKIYFFSLWLMHKKDSITDPKIRKEQKQEGIYNFMHFALCWMSVHLFLGKISKLCLGKFVPCSAHRFPHFTKN